MVPGVEDTSLSPRHHDHDGRDLEAEPHDPERMRLMIQITVFLEILISCFLGLAMIEFCQWATQPEPDPQQPSSSGMQHRRSVRLAGSGYAAGIVHRSEKVVVAVSRAERNADRFGLDEERSAAPEFSRLPQA